MITPHMFRIGSQVYYKIGKRTFSGYVVNTEDDGLIIRDEPAGESMMCKIPVDAVLLLVEELPRTSRRPQ